MRDWCKSLGLTDFVLLSFGLFVFLSLFAAGASAQAIYGSDSAPREMRANYSSCPAAIKDKNADSNKRVSTFVIEDPSNLAEDSLLRSKYEFLKWNLSEREELLEIMTEIERRFSVLTRAAKTLGPISIFRVRKLLSKVISTEPYLVSGPGYILISDKFFLAQNKQHALMHELVHLIDGYGEQAYDRRWVERMLPLMWKSKLIVQFLTEDECRRFSKTLPEVSELPTLYATINFRELLAEEISEKLSKLSEEDFTKFSSEWFGGLLYPDKARIERNRVFMRAASLYKQENFKEAAKLFRITKTSSASTILSNYYLARCYLNTDQLKESLAECDTVLRKAKVLDLMDVEELELEALITKANIFIKRKDYKLAKETLNLAVQRSPANKYCLENRALCNFELGSEVDGLIDLYKAKGQDKLMCASIKCGDYCPRMTIELLDAVSRITKSFEPLYIKAAAYRRLASTSSCKALRNRCLDSAVAALTQVMERSETSRAKAHARCGLIFIEKGDLQTASIHFDKALALDGENIPAMLGKAKLLELCGNTQECSRLCKDLRARINLLKSQALEALPGRSLHALSMDEALRIVQFTH